MVSDVGEDLGEVPVIVLGVVGEVRAEGQGVLPEGPPELKLVLECRDRLLDVPSLPGATRPFGVLNGSVRLPVGVEVVGVEQLERASRGEAQPALALGAVTKSVAGTALEGTMAFHS